MLAVPTPCLWRTSGNIYLFAPSEREKVVKKTRNVSVRKPLKEVDQDYAKSRRLSSVLQHINTFCQRRKEDKGDLLFFVLREHLRENCDPRYKEVDKIWEGHPGQMTVEDCLALRVSNLRRESNYRNQYDFLEFKQHHVFQAPNHVTEHEESYMPGSVKYTLESVSEDGESYRV